MKQLGLGLIGIGRAWGHVPGEIPSQRDAAALLEYAFELGIHYFDTAPSYGTSEERLGCFLKSLTASQRSQLTIATKFGEHWDAAKGEPFVDHSFDALKRSLDASLDRLGRIDVLQLHKTTPEVLRSAGLDRAWDYAASLGIASLGASVSDAASAALTLECARYSVIQLPFNWSNRAFDSVIEGAAARNMLVAINRPFAMGKLLHDTEPVDKTSAFEFILRRNFRGAILSGTKNKQHLYENWLAFRSAVGAGHARPAGGEGQPSKSL
jgi:aryl-alcohol dehydrogenase-like predicted oxidoreductase